MPGRNSVIDNMQGVNVGGTLATFMDFFSVHNERIQARESANKREMEVRASRNRVKGYDVISSAERQGRDLYAEVEAQAKTLYADRKDQNKYIFDSLAPIVGDTDEMSSFTRNGYDYMEKADPERFASVLRSNYDMAKERARLLSSTSTTKQAVFDEITGRFVEKEVLDATDYADKQRQLSVANYDGSVSGVDPSKAFEVQMKGMESIKEIEDAKRYNERLKAVSDAQKANADITVTDVRNASRQSQMTGVSAFGGGGSGGGSDSNGFFAGERLESGGLDIDFADRIDDAAKAFFPDNPANQKAYKSGSFAFNNDEIAMAKIIGPKNMTLYKNWGPGYTDGDPMSGRFVREIAAIDNEFGKGGGSLNELLQKHIAQGGPESDLARAVVNGQLKLDGTYQRAVMNIAAKDPNVAGWINQVMDKLSQIDVVVDGKKQSANDVAGQGILDGKVNVFKIPGIADSQNPLGQGIKSQSSSWSVGSDNSRKGATPAVIQAAEQIYLNNAPLLNDLLQKGQLKEVSQIIRERAPNATTEELNLIMQDMLSRQKPKK